MDNKRIARVGPHKVDISEVVRDPRGIEDVVTEILEHDFVESRYAQFGAWLSILPDAADIGDWDRALLERYPPLYTAAAGGLPRLRPGALPSGEGRRQVRTDHRCLPGTAEPAQGLPWLPGPDGGLPPSAGSRPEALGRGPARQHGRGPDHVGRLPAVGTLTGIYVKNLKDLNRVLSYGEAQLAKLISAGYSGTGPVRTSRAWSCMPGLSCSWPWEWLR